MADDGLMHPPKKVRPELGRGPICRGSKPTVIVAKLRQVDVLLSQGQNIADAIRV